MTALKEFDYTGSAADYQIPCQVVLFDGGFDIKVLKKTHEGIANWRLQNRLIAVHDLVGMTLDECADATFTTSYTTENGLKVYRYNY